MLYLIAAILCSSFISVFMRISTKYCHNDTGKLVINYVCCLILSLVYTGHSLLSAADTAAGSVSGAPAAQSLAFINSELLYSILFGSLQGIFYVGTFLLMQYNLNKNGIILTSTFQRLGVLVPTACAVIFFGERPALYHIIGFAIAVAAIIMINYEKGRQKVTAKGSLIILLLGGGCCDFMAKIYDETGSALYKDHFLLFTFLLALIFCFGVSLYRKERISRSDVFWGTLIGIPNYYSARFLLLSLKNVPAMIAYPTYSVSTIVIISLFGMILFKEKLSSRQKTAMAIIVIAIILLNI